MGLKNVLGKVFLPSPPTTSHCPAPTKDGSLQKRRPRQSRGLHKLLIVDERLLNLEEAHRFGPEFCIVHSGLQVRYIQVFLAHLA